MTASDRIGYALGYTASAFGLIAAVYGVTMFWGSLREALCAPVMIAIGATAYILGRWQVYGLRRETTRRP